MPCAKCGEPCHGPYCLTCTRLDAREDDTFSEKKQYECQTCEHEFKAFAGHACPDCGSSDVRGPIVEGSA